MHILIVNDDGIAAKGIQVLAESAQSFGACTIVAPHEQRSGISHAITLHSPLRLYKQGPNRYALTGTPTDCVYFGINEVCDTRPDLILSGINHGPNVGLDTLYSGTVGAGLEALRQEIPAISFSLAPYPKNDSDWQCTSRIVKEVITWLQEQDKLKPGILYNVNIPAGPVPTPAPIRATSLGIVDYPPNVVKGRDPQGGDYYWIGGLTPEYKGDDNCDCIAIQKGFVSITPIRTQMTDTATLNELQTQLNQKS